MRHQHTPTASSAWNSCNPLIAAGLVLVLLFSTCGNCYAASLDPAQPSPVTHGDCDDPENTGSPGTCACPALMQRALVDPPAVFDAAGTASMDEPLPTAYLRIHRQTMEVAAACLARDEPAFSRPSLLRSFCIQLE